MQTNFTLKQLTDPKIGEVNQILRKCVHCGFCIATCPTYILRGDELDSPRGRIYLIKNMLEKNVSPSAKTVKHIDRCLSCLSCLTTCPASVDYMHLVDHARFHIKSTFQRPFSDRLFRKLLVFLLPYPGRFRLSLIGALLVKSVANFFPNRIKDLILAAPKTLPRKSPLDKAQVVPANGKRIKRVALLNGCAQQVLKPNINEATIRLLTRHGCEVVIADGAGCCGALAHHLGEEKKSIKAAKDNILAWERAHYNTPLDAIIVNASGCGTTIKDYENLLTRDPIWSNRAKKISGLTQDISEFMFQLGLKIETVFEKPKIAYHSACSLQHGQKIHHQPIELLKTAGFHVLEPKEPHICCGSAGTYSFLEPDLAKQLQSRKNKNLKATNVKLVAAGNIGCIAHLSLGMNTDDGISIVHTAELLDWATGGPKPELLP